MLSSFPVRQRGDDFEPRFSSQTHSYFLGGVESMQMAVLFTLL
jgi:hypothetical protein